MTPILSFIGALCVPVLILLLLAQLVRWLDRDDPEQPGDSE